jgi:hypothetical protein
MLDDGNKERGNRNALLDPSYSYIGVAHVPHKVYNHCTVIILACDIPPTTVATLQTLSSNQGVGTGVESVPQVTASFRKNTYL